MKYLYKLVRIQQDDEVEKYNNCLEKIFDEKECRRRYGYRKDLFNYLNNELPNFNNQNFILLLISLVEYSFNLICNSLQSKLNEKISFQDIYGKGIARAKNYIHKLVGFNLSSVTNWNHIILIRDIRNSVSHSLGVVEKENLKQKINKSSDIKLCDDAVLEYFIIESKFIEDSLERVSVFF